MQHSSQTIDISASANSDNHAALVPAKAIATPCFIDDTMYHVTTARNRIMRKALISDAQFAELYRTITRSHLRLRVEYPTQSRNFDNSEWDALEASWLELFCDVEPEILHEAVIRFIAKDRKGYWPNSGQIMSAVEDVLADLEKQRREQQSRQEAEQLKRYYQRIKNGENCGTCRHCEHKKERQPWLINEATTKLYCQNPKSYKFHGNTGGRGTAASILCDFYEPIPH